MSNKRVITLSLNDPLAHLPEPYPTGDFGGMTAKEMVDYITSLHAPREQATAILEAAAVIDPDEIELDFTDDHYGCCGLCSHIPEFCTCEDGPTLP